MDNVTDKTDLELTDHELQLIHGGNQESIEDWHVQLGILTIFLNFPGISEPLEVAGAKNYFKMIINSSTCDYNIRSKIESFLECVEKNKHLNILMKNDGRPKSEDRVKVLERNIKSSLNAFDSSLLSGIDLNAWIRDLMMHQHMSKVLNLSPEEMNNRLDSVTYALTGINPKPLYSSLEKGDWEKFIAHLTHLEGENYSSVELEGWWQDRFLVFRVRIILTMLIELENTPQNIAPSDQVKDYRYLLYSEFTCTLEALHVYNFCLNTQKISDERKRTELNNQFAKKLCDHIKNLPEGKVFYFCLNLPEHAIYISFKVLQSKIQVRIDNLGYGIKDRHEIDKIDKIKYIYPYFVKQISKNSSDDSLKNYLTNLLEISSTPENNDDEQLDRLLEKIYNLRCKSKSNLKRTDLRFPEQKVGNCVVAGFQVGLRARLKSDDNFERFLQKEMSILGSIYVPISKRTLSELSKPLITSLTRIPQELWESLKQKYIQISDQETTGDKLTRIQNNNIHFRFSFDSADHRRYYTEFDMNILLKEYVTQTKLGDFLPLAVDAVRAEMLEETISKLPDLISIGFEPESFKPPREISHQRVLIPVLLSSSEWVLIICESQRKKENQINVCVASVSKKESSFKDNINLIFNKYFNKKIVIRKINLKDEKWQNIDIHDTGPLIACFAELVAEPKTLNFEDKFEYDKIKTYRENQASKIIKSNNNSENTIDETELTFGINELIKDWHCNNSSANCLWINAPAGYGKSRLCGYLAGNNKIKHMDDKIVWIKLRHIKVFSHESNFNNSSEVIAYLRDIFWKGNVAQSDRENYSECPWWYAQLTENSLKNDDITFIFDGFDELSLYAQANFVKFMQKILEERSLNNLHMIVTSRPQFFFDFSILKDKIILRNIAPLNADERNEFIDKFYRDNSNASGTIKKFLQSRPGWDQLMETPFNLEILCNVWNQKEASRVNINTVTELYLQIFDFMLKKAFMRDLRLLTEDYSISTSSWRGHYKRAISIMSGIAYQLLSQKKLRFEKGLRSLIKDCDESVKTNIQNIGLLQLSDDMVEFPHKTFCEFMCAYYIATNLNKADKKQQIKRFIMHYKHDPYFYKVWSFTAGLLHSLNKPYLFKFWEVLLQKPWDYTGKRQIPLLVNCLEESQFSAKLPYREELYKLLINSWHCFLDDKNSHRNSLFSSLFSATPYLLDHPLKDQFHQAFISNNNKWKLLKSVGRHMLRKNESDWLLGSISNNINVLLSNSESENQYELKRDIEGCLAVFSRAEVKPKQVDELVENVTQWAEDAKASKHSQIIKKLLDIIEKYLPISSLAFEFLEKCVQSLLNEISSRNPSIPELQYKALNLYLSVKKCPNITLNEKSNVLYRIYRNLFKNEKSHSAKSTLCPKLNFVDLVNKAGSLGPNEEKLFSMFKVGNDGLLISDDEVSPSLYLIPLHQQGPREKMTRFLIENMNRYSIRFYRRELLWYAEEQGFANVKTKLGIRLIEQIIHMQLYDKAPVFMGNYPRTVLFSILDENTITKFICGASSNAVIDYFEILNGYLSANNKKIDYVNKLVVSINDKLLLRGFSFGDDVQEKYSKIKSHLSECIKYYQSRHEKDETLESRHQYNYFSSHSMFSANSDDEEDNLTKIIKNLLNLSPYDEVKNQLLNDSRNILVDTSIHKLEFFIDECCISVNSREFYFKPWHSNIVSQMLSIFKDRLLAVGIPEVLFSLHKNHRSNIDISNTIDEQMQLLKI